MAGDFHYKIFVPGGNDTALVMGIVDDIDTRHMINDSIMQRHKNVEQVGFVSLDYGNPKLVMAGGEFCGNATRSATMFYLDGKPGEIEITVSGVSRKLKAGIFKNLDVWAEMPVSKQLDKIHQVDDGCYMVEMEGIVHLVIIPQKSKEYLGDVSNLKYNARELLKKYKLLSRVAAGVIFVSEQATSGVYAIHPCVYVSAIETMFYETACGSGTVATGLVFSYLKKQSIDLPLIQPSGNVLNAVIEQSNGVVTSAVISGSVYTNDIVYKGD